MLTPSIVVIVPPCVGACAVGVHEWAEAHPQVAPIVLLVVIVLLVLGLIIFGAWMTVTYWVDVIRGYRRKRRGRDHW